MNLVVDLPCVCVCSCVVCCLCACVELPKGSTHLPCMFYFALVPFCFTFFCHVYFVLPLLYCDFIFLDLEGSNYKI